MYASINLLIADDHDVFSQRLCTNIGAAPGLSLLAVAQGSAHLLQLMEEHHPDVVVTETELADGDGIDTGCQIRKIYPHVGVVAVGLHPPKPTIYKALAGDIGAYLLRKNDTKVFVDAIKTVYAGRTYYTNNDRVSFYTSSMIKETKPPFLPREIRIIQLICHQKNSQQIAEELCLSHRTIEDYRAVIMQKMGVTCAAGLAVYAVEHGLLEDITV